MSWLFGNLEKRLIQNDVVKEKIKIPYPNWWGLVFKVDFYLLWIGQHNTTLQLSLQLWEPFWSSQFYLTPPIIWKKKKNSKGFFKLGLAVYQIVSNYALIQNNNRTWVSKSIFPLVIINWSKTKKWPQLTKVGCCYKIALIIILNLF